MENLNSVINWREKEKELLSVLNNSLEPSERFNKLWIDYTKMGSVFITVFVNPYWIEGKSGSNGFWCSYNGYTQKNIQDWSIENLKNIVLSQLKNKISATV